MSAIYRTEASVAENKVISAEDEMQLTLLQAQRAPLIRTLVVFTVLFVASVVGAVSGDRRCWMYVLFDTFMIGLAAWKLVTYRRRVRDLARRGYAVDDLALTTRTSR